MSDTIEREGKTWHRVCGEPIRGMYTAFPCCRQPGHEGDHTFAAYWASYREVNGQIYEWQGRERS